MASSLFIPIEIASATVLGSIFGYDAFWAYRIRSALFVRLYRNQALGILILTIAFALIFIFSAPAVPLLIGTPSAAIKSPLLIFLIAFEISITGSFLTLFYFLDYSILIARRTDPLLRDTFNWRKARVALWIILIALEALGFAHFIGILYNINLPAVASLFSDLVPVIFIILVGGILLPVSALRSRDRTLRRHLEWFGLFVFLAYAGLIPGDIVGANTLTLLVTDLIWLASGYCIYRSVKSLVPLNKLSIKTET